MNDALDSLLERLARGDMDAAGGSLPDVSNLSSASWCGADCRRDCGPSSTRWTSCSRPGPMCSKGSESGGWRFADREHLRAYLARVTYNHLVKLLSPAQPGNAV